MKTFFSFLLILIIVFNGCQKINEEDNYNNRKIDKGKVLDETVTFIYNGQEVTYGTVEFAGSIWMDRNIGASQVATSITDALGFGDLFQWGREADGHQIREEFIETVSADLSLKVQPGHSLFITSNSQPFDWANNGWESRWVDINGYKTNADVCPDGWRVPTQFELQDAIDNFESMDAEGAFNSILKLPLAGKRDPISGGLVSLRDRAGIWGSTGYNDFAHVLGYHSHGGGVFGHGRATGYSVRCVKDE